MKSATQIVCVATVVAGLGAAVSAAAPGELLLTIHSPGRLYGGFGHSLSVNGDEIVIGAYSRSVVFRYDGHGNLLATYPSDIPGWSGLGASVAYDGDRIIAGGPFWSTNSSVGRASVIDTASGQFIQTTIGSVGSYHGWATAISEDYYAIGAMGANKVYVHDRQSNSQNYVLASAGWFGFSLAAEGDRLLAGAPTTSDGAMANAGAAYLYEASSQTLLRTFESPNPSSGAFGWSVAQRHGQVLVGAPHDNGVGAAYLFDADTGGLLQSFPNPYPSLGDRFGWSVAFSGDFVVVGATKDGNGPEPSGAAYAFNIDSGDLAAEFFDPAPLDDGEFGWAVAGFDGLAVVSGQANGHGFGEVHFFAIPEPATLGMLALGGLAVLRRRSRRSCFAAENDWKSTNH